MYDLLNNNTSLTISNANAMISLQPGEFKVYGSNQVTLGLSDFNLSDLITIYPNPLKNEFKINSNTNNVIIYDISGRIIKNFKGNFEKDEAFNISDLKSAIYLVRINANLGTLTKK